MTLVDVGGLAVEIPEEVPERDRNRRRAYTPEEMIALARAWDRDVGAPPSQADWDPAQRRYYMRGMLDRITQHRATIKRFEQGGFPAAVTVRKHFGSWNSFLHACGWEPRDQHRPRINTVQVPDTPTLEQVRRRVGRRAEARLGVRDALAAVVRRVLEAEKANDEEALVACLHDGAAELIAWADRLERKAAT